MRFLTDENIAVSVVATLREHGYDVIDVKEKQWFGKPDRHHISFAERQKRIIVTHDKDFTYQEMVPVILLRFRDQKPLNVQRELIAFLNRQEVSRLKKPMVAVLSELGVEFHKPFMTP